MYLQTNLPINYTLQGGKYRIVRFISSGGFGCTYEAEHVQLKKRVAIKEFFVKDFCNRDETTAHITVGTVSKKGLVEKLRSKFIDEARALAQLQHPGIVSVSDVFEENGTAYFVMAYVDGKSLSEIVREQGPLPEDKAVRYIKLISNALQYVHENNRLHLDIKPGNIMVDGSDNPVLIDFGASKQYDEESGENTSTLMGKTPGYAPLEQMGDDVVKFTPATDIYALGATLYKLLTGDTPLSASILASGESMKPLPANISTATRVAVATAMEMNKNRRPQSLIEFVELFEHKQPLQPEDEDTVLDDEKTTINHTDYVIKTEQEEDYSNDITKVDISFWGKNKGYVIIGCCVVVGLFIGYLVFNKNTVPIDPDKSQESSLMEGAVTPTESASPTRRPTQKDEDINAGEPIKQNASEKPSPRIVTGTLSLGYGIWNGGIKNGKPHGQGRVTFSEKHRVDKSTLYEANAGDYFEANYDNGSLIHGRLYDKEGNLIKTIVP